MTFRICNSRPVGATDASPFALGFRWKLKVSAIAGSARTRFFSRLDFIEWDNHTITGIHLVTRRVGATGANRVAERREARALSSISRLMRLYPRFLSLDKRLKDGIGNCDVYCTSVISVSTQQV